LYRAIQIEDSDLAICGVKNIEDEVRNMEEERLPFGYETYDRLDVLYKLLYHKLVVGIWAVLIKRKIMKGLWFSEGYKYSEDLEMVWKLTAASRKVVCVRLPLYYYRLRNGSAMSVVNEKRIDGYHLMVCLEDYFCEKTPAFYPAFCKYGVARWTWATLWQAAVASKSYTEFIDNVAPYSPKENMKKLYRYPELRVQLTSALYVLLPALYYNFVRLCARKFRVLSK
jgi:hypothetical protein